MNNVYKTFGGKSNLASALESKSKFLSVNLTGGDETGAIAGAGIYADRDLSSDFLLQVKRRRPKSNNTQHSNSDSHHSDIKYEIIARISDMYNFKGMSDFKYISSTNTTEGNIIEKIRDVKLKNNNSNIPEYDELFLPPPTFSRIDIPIHYRYQNNNLFTIVDTIAGKKWTKRKAQPKINHIVVRFGDKIPGQHTQALAPLLDPQKKKLEELIKNLFTIHPIWSLLSLRVNLPSYSLAFIRIVLSRHAYYFSNGPWRTCWIKLGFDPTIPENKNARRYQIVDFRCSKSQTRKRSKGEDFKTPTRHSESFTLDVNLYDKKKILETEQEAPKETQQSLENRFLVPPTRQQTIYQLCHIEIPELQGLINSCEINSTPNQKTGWFRTATYKQIRKIMNQRLAEMLASDKIGNNNDEHLSEEEIGKGKSKKEKRKKKSKEGKEEEEEEGDGGFEYSLSELVKLHGEEKRLYALKLMDQVERSQAAKKAAILDASGLSEHDTSYPLMGSFPSSPTYPNLALNSNNIPPEVCPSPPRKQGLGLSFLLTELRDSQQEFFSNPQPNAELKRKSNNPTKKLKSNFPNAKKLINYSPLRNSPSTARSAGDGGNNNNNNYNDT
eukprot:CAMPEP_0174270746 /NCGR_PEP_ID=MMETSP0439-20130205/45594_1 /TAXON_ID=0 /ORGANISM="Stereomyxa ramosa, Strain Chinc5" /LENGTH=610 /DNA_ID=CAMNT_0015360265 /DNA_START=6 /DNA_END=1834 /DNA_ORIENTATION=+